MGGRGFPILEDQRWLRAQVEAGRSDADIAAEVGCSLSTVSTAIQVSGLSGIRRPARRPLHNIRLANEAWLRRRVDAGRSPNEIAALADASPRTVRTWLRRHRIPPPATPRVSNELLSNREWLLAQIASGLTADEIAELSGTASGTVRAWVKRHDLTEQWATAHGHPRRRLLEDRTWLAAQLAAGETRSSIGRLHGFNKGTVAAAMARFGLVTKREATKRDRTKAVKRHLAGESTSAIAKSMNRKAATVQAWVRQAGHEPTVRRYSTEEKQAVLQRVRNGERTNDVAHDSGIDPTTIRAWLRATR